MTIAYWTIVIMTVYPYVFTGMAKSLKEFDHSRPRVFASTLTGWRQRAYWIQKNTFEILPMFIAAVLISQQLAGPAHQSRIDDACIFFVITRIAYAIAYLKDRAKLRTLCWALGFLAILYLYGLSASL